MTAPDALEGVERCRRPRDRPHSHRACPPAHRPCRPGRALRRPHPPHCSAWQHDRRPSAPIKHRSSPRLSSRYPIGPSNLLGEASARVADQLVLQRLSAPKLRAPGGVAERLNAAALKAVDPVARSVGSNPTPSADMPEPFVHTLPRALPRVRRAGDRVQRELVDVLRRDADGVVPGGVRLLRRARGGRQRRGAGGDDRALQRLGALRRRARDLRRDRAARDHLDDRRASPPPATARRSSRAAPSTCSSILRRWASRPIPGWVREQLEAYVIG